MPVPGRNGTCRCLVSELRRNPPEFRWNAQPSRWADRLEPLRQTGNRERATIVGVDLLSLVTYITDWPDATLDEMAIFI